MAIITFENVSKSYKKQAALKNINLSIKKGKIVGLLGNNGAGKTTMMKLCMGLLKPTEGNISVLEKTPFTRRAALNEQVAYIPDEIALEGWMTGRGLVDFMGDIHPRWNKAKAEDILKTVDLPLDQKIRNYSKGMKLQLNLAIAVATNAEVLVLDEPTLGLDVHFRQLFIDTILGDYFDEEKTILISTHHFEEIEHIFEDVIFIHEGTIRCHASVAELKKQFVLFQVDAGKQDYVDHKDAYKIGALFDKEVFITEQRLLSACGKTQPETKQPSLMDIYMGITKGNLIAKENFVNTALQGGV